MARVLKPPTKLQWPAGERTVFLAGSIDMGAAEDWQAEVERSLADLPITILNPRRDEWDSSWAQTFENPLFREQVEWEIDGLECANVIAMYFAPGSQAPITLLEFGLFARSGKLVVCSPKGFWRRGNLEVVCANYGVPLMTEKQEWLTEVRRMLAPRFGWST